MRTLKTIIGALLLLMGFYVVVTAILILFGWTDTPFSEISIPFYILLIAFVFKVFRIMKTDTSKVKEKAQEKIIDQYNPHIDVLELAMYEQKCETWWSDSDGDSHHRPTVYACLRFYEDGTIIGIRDRSILKLEDSSSFVYKGIWSLKENRLHFNLEKVKEIDDAVKHTISKEEERNMKYAGHVANDYSLIKNGIYSGTVKGNTLYLNDFHFTLVKMSLLIITASEESCDELYAKFKNHALVNNCYTNSGNWYSNGETGPEWFTVTFESRYELKDDLERDIKEYSTDYSNMFWS